MTSTVLSLSYAKISLKVELIILFSGLIFIASMDVSIGIATFLLLVGTVYQTGDSPEFVLNKLKVKQMFILCSKLFVLFSFYIRF